MARKRKPDRVRIEPVQDAAAVRLGFSELKSSAADAMKTEVDGAARWVKEFRRGTRNATGKSREKVFQKMGPISTPRFDKLATKIKEVCAALRADERRVREIILGADTSAVVLRAGDNVLRLSVGLDLETELAAAIEEREISERHLKALKAVHALMRRREWPFTDPTDPMSEHALASRIDLLKARLDYLSRIGINKKREGKLDKTRAVTTRTLELERYLADCTLTPEERAARLKEATRLVDRSRDQHLHGIPSVATRCAVELMKAAFPTAARSLTPGRLRGRRAQDRQGIRAEHRRKPKG